jgi:hypothetical protein
MVPISLSSPPYTGVPSTLSLPISETVSRRLSTVVAMLVLLEASDCETHFSENVHWRRSFRQWTKSAARRHRRENVKLKSGRHS